MSKALKYNYDLDVFYRKDAVSWYLLGAWITDGSVSLQKNNKVSVALTSQDIDWLETIRDLICKDLPLRQTASKAKVLGIYCSELGRWLISNGCILRKSLNAYWPDVPEEYLPDFIRGLIDGDGWLCNTDNNTCIGFGGASKPLIDGFMKNSLSSQDIRWSLHITEPTNDDGSLKTKMIGDRVITMRNTFYRITLARLVDIQKFLAWVYYPGNPLSMPRKQKLADQIVILPQHNAHSNPNNLMGKRVLDREQVAIIRLRLAVGEKGSMLAKEFGVQTSAISKIKNGTRWKQ